MKTTLTRTTIQAVRLVMLNIVLLFGISLSANAGIKNNDQELVIHTQGGCTAQVDLASADDNCQGSEFQPRCGKNGKDCVCIKKSKFISWTIDNNARFELTFNGASPFTHSCKLKSGNNSKVKCKIDTEQGDFEYNVIVEGCQGQQYDPIIIVRK